VSNFAYDELNRVSLAEHGTSSGWIFARSHYQYDPVSREVATWRDEDNGLGSQRGERFSYSPSNQLTSANYNAQQVWSGTPQNATRSVGYTYSPDTLNRQSVNDNGAVTIYSPSALNQYQSNNGTIYNYDYNFNL